MHTTPPRKTKGPKPKLRGVSHLLGAIATLPAGYILRGKAAGSESATPLTVYLAGLFLLLGVSALYHVPMWAPRVRANLRRLDRSMIYVFVAGTYTPLVVKLGASVWGYTLHAVWAAALSGVAIAIFVSGAPRWVTALPYVVLGWGAVILMPEIYSQLGASPFWLITLGGILYTIGAISYAFKLPDPFPAVFGYHEIFHLLVVIAAALHYAAILEIST